MFELMPIAAAILVTTGYLAARVILPHLGRSTQTVPSHPPSEQPGTRCLDWMEGGAPEYLLGLGPPTPEQDPTSGAPHAGARAMIPWQLGPPLEEYRPPGDALCSGRRCSTTRHPYRDRRLQAPMED